MRTRLFSSLLFALLASVSVATTAAPAGASNSGAPAVAASVMDPASTAQSQENRGKVNLNSADAATLQKELSGIGKGKAEAIVAHREANGHFTSIDELVEVKGIGKALLEKNRERLSVE